MEHGPASESPNPLQRFAARGPAPAAAVFSVLLVLPIIPISVANGHPFWWTLRLAAIALLLAFVATWIAITIRVRRDPGVMGEHVMYFPWFGSARRSTER